MTDEEVIEMIQREGGTYTVSRSFLNSWKTKRLHAHPTEGQLKRLVREGRLSSGATLSVSPWTNAGLTPRSGRQHGVILEVQL